MSTATRRMMLLYWGRRGALNRLALELARASASVPDLTTTFSISRQNESFDVFEGSVSSLFPVTTFESTVGAFTGVRRIPALRRALAGRLAAERTDTVVALMPHVWTQLMIDTVHEAGARYVTVVHDAAQHPGDLHHSFHHWLMRETSRADHVVTLSRSVASQLAARTGIAPQRISTLFLPDIRYGDATCVPLTAPASAANPLRLLFFGRVLAYKGLPRLLDAIEQLRQQRVPVHLSVCGSGDLTALRPRLEAIGADVQNRWIPEDEVAALFRRSHAVILSHSEASQSGVAAVAFGAGVPVIAVPVGGIVEQIRHGETGLLAAGTDSASLADTIGDLAGNPALHRQLREGIARTASQRTPTRFLSALADVARVLQPAEPRTA